MRNGAIGRIRQINAVAFDNLLLFNDPSKMPEGERKIIENSGEIRPFLEDILKVGNWRDDPTVAGGSMFVDQHTHHIDLMLWLVGASAREVSCLLTRDGFPVERAITTQARLDNGVLFSLSYTNGVDADQEKHFGKTDIIITGDAGVIHCVEGQLGPDGTQVELISGGERRQITSQEETGGPAGMFINLITENGENPTSSEECAWAVSLIEASYRSAEEKRIVKTD